MGGRDPKARRTLRVTVGETPVTIHAFPQDARFVRDIERVLAGLASPTLSEARLRTRLEDDLRAWYPMVEVRRREELADLEPDEELWYAMRDGRIGRPRETVDRLYAAMSDARVTFATSAEVLEQAEATLSRTSTPRTHVDGATGDANVDGTRHDADDMMPDDTPLPFAVSADRQ